MKKPPKHILEKAKNHIWEKYDHHANVVAGSEDVDGKDARDAVECLEVFEWLESLDTKSRESMPLPSPPQTETGL